MNLSWGRCDDRWRQIASMIEKEGGKLVDLKKKKNVGNVIGRILYGYRG